MIHMSLQDKCSLSYAYTNWYAFFSIDIRRRHYCCFGFWFRAFKRTLDLGTIALDGRSHRENVWEKSESANVMHLETEVAP